MAIDALNVWKDELENLPPEDNQFAGGTQFAQWYADRIVNIEPDPAILVPTGFAFVFNVPVMAALLSVLPSTFDQIAGVTSFSNAWEAALLASPISTAAGTFIVPTSPTTLFSSVTTTVLDLPSIAAGKAKIIELGTAPPTDSAQTSDFPVKFRDATLLLTITVTGLDSTPGGSGGPLPLTAPGVPLI